MTHKEIEWNCPECSGNKTQYTVKIIQTNRPSPYPKYTLQIKESCITCGRYRRFAPQTPILIKRINDRLENIILPSKGRDYYE